jgi:hypothetical protein
VLILDAGFFNLGNYPIHEAHHSEARSLLGSAFSLDLPLGHFDAPSAAVCGLIVTRITAVNVWKILAVCLKSLAYHPKTMAKYRQTLYLGNV